MRDAALPGGEALTGGRARSIVAGAVAAALAFALAGKFFDVGVTNADVPIWYEGDALFSLALVKGVLDHGELLHNPDLGAPHGLDLHDFPLPYGLHLAALRAIGLFTDDPGLAVNALWLLGFAAIAACAFAAFRLLDLPRAESAAAGVLYAFLPYHLERGQSHLFLSMYYVVPLAAALAVRLYRDAPRLSGARTWTLRPRVSLRTALLAAALALALGASGVYYAFFGCFFLAAAGVLGALRARSAAPLGAAALLLTLIAATVVVSIAPNLLYRREHGPNPIALQRSASEAEIFGLKIAPMLLPVRSHAIPSWADLRQRYDAVTPLHNESGSATLGVAAGAGFLLLLGWALGAIARRDRQPLLDGLAALNLAGLLLATTSGFGALTALLGLPQIRAYNRISIWLAFFALAALIAVTRPLRDRLMRRRGGAAIGALLVAAMLALALTDVMSPGYRPQRKLVRQRVAIDRAFVATAEATLPPDTAVFQLPYVGYPETVPPARMAYYDPLRPYLQSHGLRWSHGAMKGRPEADAIAALALQPVTALPHALVAAGYGALLLDTFGYTPADEAVLRAALENELGTPIATSEDGRLLLFRLPVAQPIANPS